MHFNLQPILIQFWTLSFPFPFQSAAPIKCNFIIIMAFFKFINMPRSEIECKPMTSIKSFLFPCSVSVSASLFSLLFSVSVSVLPHLSLGGWTWKMHFIYGIWYKKPQFLGTPYYFDWDTPDRYTYVCLSYPLRLILTFSDSFFIAIVCCWFRVAVCLSVYLFCFIFYFFLFIFSLCFTN